jgi:hypothetical protein
MSQPELKRPGRQQDQAIGHWRRPKRATLEERKEFWRALFFPFRINRGGTNSFGDCSEFLFNLRLIFGELRLLCLDFFDQRQKSLFRVRVRRLRAATMTRPSA